MSNQDAIKQRVAEAAMKFVEDDMVVGVGTGSTVNFFIDALAGMKHRIHGAVSSSEASTNRLTANGIRVLDLNDTGGLPLYVDGADESDRHRRLIKGGGGALTREKIVAGASERFVCIVDESKIVDVLGAFPLPVEVIPMAQSYVARQIVRQGGQPELRSGFTTDNSNVILDVYNLQLTDPVAMERTLTCIPGVVTVGIFALRPADLVLVGSESGVCEL